MKVGISLTKARNKKEGITRYAIEVCNYLSNKDNIELTGECVIGLGDSKKRIAEEFKESIRKVHIKVLKTVIPKRYIMRLYDDNQRIPFCSDIFFSNKKDVKIYFYNFIPRIKENCKKILVVHDLTPMHEAKTKKEKEKWRKKYQRSVNFADLIFVDSEYTKKDLLRNVNTEEKKVKVNYCGVNLEQFKVEIREEQQLHVREKYGLPKKFLLFVGQPRPNKNLYGLIQGFVKAIEIIGFDYKLVLSKSNEEIKKYIHENKIENNIIELNGIDEKDLPFVYKCSSGLALISFSEGFGLPLLEAMCSGIPTITSNASCLPEIVGDASILCNPFDIDDISQRIVELLLDKNTREMLIANGYRQIEKYNWEKTGESFYQEIMKICTT